MPRPDRDPDSVFEGTVAYSTAYRPKYGDRAIDRLVSQFDRETFVQDMELTLITGGTSRER